MSKVNATVLVQILPEFLTDKTLGDFKDPVVDTRWAPFVEPKTHAALGLPYSDEVVIDRWYGPAYFFDRVRTLWKEVAERDRFDMNPPPHSEDSYVDSVNIWLGIVSHFGMDAEYRPEFMTLVKPIILEVMVSAYRDDPKNEKLTNERTFHDLIYSREDFQREFNAFIMRNHLLF